MEMEFKPILLAAAKVQSIVPSVFGSRNNPRDARRERGEERKL
jgi:hypothetical protein